MNLWAPTIATHAGEVAVSQLWIAKDEPMVRTRKRVNKRQRRRQRGRKREAEEGGVKMMTLGMTARVGGAERVNEPFC